MNSSSLLLRPAFACAILLGAAALRADETVNTIKFSHPEKPGTFKVAVARGGLRIHGSDTAEVTVKSEAQPQHHKRKDGLRVLTESASYALSEKDNVITLDGGGDGWMGAPADFDITVPKSTNVVIANSLGGDVVCAGVTGDLEIKSLAGEVTLTGISGSAVVETMNGEISATVTELHDGKSLSFTSMNGAVVVRIPENAKANVQLRTQNGTILTDFDEKALVTKVQNVRMGRNRREMLTPEMHNAIREVTRASVMAAKEIAQAAQEAARAARDGSGDDDGDDNDHDESVGPVPPVPPMPSIPPVTGGKLVSGVLNGGGPEIRINTMNGDVTLRKIDR